ncbi:MAG: recombination-associated protein RdgC, partial [Plesiomonas sp.]
MWFKNLKLFRMTRDVITDAEQLNKQLEQFCFS